MIAGGLEFKVRGEETRDAVIVEQVVEHNIYRLPDDMAGQVVFDIGGHVGTVALMCAKRGAVVYTFEPERETYQSLLANIDANVVKGQIIPFNLAVGPSGLKKLYHHRTEHGVSSFFPYISKLDGSYEYVWSVSLKEVIQRLGYPDLLKLDCEGSETLILPKLLKHFQSYIPEILVEFHQSDAVMQGWTDKLSEFYNITPLSHVEFKLKHK